MLPNWALRVIAHRSAGARGSGVQGLSGLWKREWPGRARAVRSRSIRRCATSFKNDYISKVEKKNGELYNVEFATFTAVKDPVNAAEQK
jgi:hypothetical protein